MRFDVRGEVTALLEDLAGDILTSTGCPFVWGEVELPECLRSEVEENEKNM